MRKISLFIIAMAFVSTLAMAQNKAQRFAIKSGHITWELSGNTTGTKSLWWDDYGNKTRTEENTVTVTRILGMRSETKTHTVTITKGDQFWSVNMEDNTGQSGTLPYYDDYDNYGELSEAEQKQMEDDILAAFGGRRVGSEKVMGYTCEIIEVMGAKTWVYKGVSLKSEAKIMGITVNERATQFDPGARVSVSRFDPPAGIRYQDTDALQRQMFVGLDDFDDEEYYDEDDEDDVIPVTYPFNKFRDVVNAIQYKNLKASMITHDDGQHFATLSGGGMHVAIVATGFDGSGNEDLENLESFTRNGKKYHYGRTEEGGCALIEEYPRHAMVVLYYSADITSREGLMDIASKAKF